MRGVEQEERVGGAHLLPATGLPQFRLTLHSLTGTALPLLQSGLSFALQKQSSVRTLLSFGFLFFAGRVSIHCF